MNDLFSQWGKPQSLESMMQGFGAPSAPAAPNPMAFDLGVNLNANTTAGTTDWMSALSKFVGGQKNADGTASMGVGGATLGGLQSLASLWAGMKNYGLAKDQLAFSKDAFNKNYTNSVKDYNTRLEGRATEMAAANPNAMSVSDYMAKHGIKG